VSRSDGYSPHCSEAPGTVYGRIDMSEPVTRQPRARNGSSVESKLGAEAPVSNGDAHTEFEHESPPGMPRWVKMSALVIVLLFLIVAGLHLTGNAPTHGIPTHGVP
jgi:hypothetical protein